MGREDPRHYWKMFSLHLLFLALHRVHATSHLLPLGSVSCVDHAWVELPGDRSRRVSWPEDHLDVGARERTAGGQGSGQSLQTRNQGGIL